MNEKNLYIIAGCNGAGKTTASFTILPDILDCKEFVNADDLFKLNLIKKIRLRVITTYESLEDFEKKAVEYLDTLYFEQPFNDTIFIESTLPIIEVYKE